jgi:hypothetical protein
MVVLPYIEQREVSEGRRGDTPLNTRDPKARTVPSSVRGHVPRQLFMQAALLLMIERNLAPHFLMEGNNLLAPRNDENDILLNSNSLPAVMEGAKEKKDVF